MSEHDKTFEELEAAGWTLRWDPVDPETGTHVAHLVLRDEEQAEVFRVSESGEDPDFARSAVVRSANAYLAAINTDPR